MKTPDQGASQQGWIGAASGRRQSLPIVTVVVILCLVAGLHLALWGLLEPRATAAAVDGKLPSVSYNRFAKSADFEVPETRIRDDLTAIAKQAKAVRTYGSTKGLERVPEIAAELGLAVTPRLGHAAYFEYCDNRGFVDWRSVHAGSPVLEGEKWVASKWMRQRQFASA